MEENLTLNELYELLDACREREHERRKFAAALKGVNLDEEHGESQESRFDEVKRRAEAKLRGMSEEQMEMQNIGVGYVLEE